MKCPRVCELETLRDFPCFLFGSVPLPDVEVRGGSQREREGVCGGGRLGDGPRL